MQREVRYPVVGMRVARHDMLSRNDQQVLRRGATIPKTPLFVVICRKEIRKRKVVGSGPWSMRLCARKRVVRWVRFDQIAEPAIYPTPEQRRDASRRLSGNQDAPDLASG